MAKGPRKQNTFEHIYSVAEEHFGKNKFTLLGEDNANNVHEKVIMHCNMCDDEYPKRINDLLHGYGCRSCNFTGHITKIFRTPDSFKQEVEELTDGEFSVLSNYESTRGKCLFKHNQCQHTFEMKVHNFITLHQRCPYCKKHSMGTTNSRGITIIESWLLKHNYSFEKEKKFSDLRSPKSNILLPYDIFIPELNLIIEYDGEQHFRPIEIFGGETYFKRVQFNDQVKNEYATKNNIHLLRIKFNLKSHIPEILTATIQRILDQGSTTSKSLFVCPKLTKRTK